MALRHFFLPHPHTHNKAHLISNKAFIVYILFFLVFNLSIHHASTAKPQVLGISTSITAQDLIHLTNIERAKKGLGELKENAELDKAAQAKAANMFAENYWAHFSPSGKDPWSFILAAGYHFSYAGENLAKNFSSSQDVVDAWVKSPSHYENIINPHYTDIGMAVATGTLQGEDTILVVQEFASPNGVVAEGSTPKTPVAPIPSPSVVPSTEPVTNELPETSQNLVLVPPETKPQILPVSVPPPAPLIDAFAVAKYASLSVIIFLGLLLAIDFAMLKKRGVVRVSSHHYSHFALLAVAGATLASSQAGSILEGMATAIK